MHEGVAADARWNEEGQALYNRWWTSGGRARDPRGVPQGTADMILELDCGTCLWQGGQHVAFDLRRLRRMNIGKDGKFQLTLYFPKDS